MLVSLDGNVELAKLVRNEPTNSAKVKRRIRKGPLPRCDVQRSLELTSVRQRVRKVRGNAGIEWPALMRDFEMANRGLMIARSNAEHAQHGVQGDWIAPARQCALSR